MTFRIALLTVLFAGGVAAQETPSLLAQADEAYRQGRYAEAVRTLERVTAAETENAEAHYLLARVLFDPDNPARNERQAGREIARALDLDPQNEVYLVAQLEQFRGDAWNFFQELMRERRRREISRQLLAIDSTNAYAHEELGVQAIGDYYKYRNAIALPGLGFASTAAPLGEEEVAEVQEDAGFGAGGALDQTLAGGPVDLGGSEIPTQGMFDGDAEFATDRFDVEGFEERGIPVTTFEERAARSYDRAIGHLRQAVESDPRRRPVYDHLVRLVALSGQYEDAIPLLREMYVQFPEDPWMWLYLGTVNHRLGDDEAADVAFRNALEQMDEETRTAFTDLTLILPPDEWRDFRADPEAFARRYWTSRDPRFLNTANERRSEHFARLVTAELLYRSEDLEIPGWRTERGQLHVRYGVPQADVVIEGEFGLIVEQFDGRDESFADDPFQALNRFNVWDYGDFRLVFEDPLRNGRFQLYSPPADVFGLSSARFVQNMDFVQIAQDVVRETPERYTFEAPGRQVELPYRVTAFKGDGGQTDVYVNYGVPVDDGAEAAGAARPDVDVTIRTGAFLIGPSRDLQIERRRTVYGLRGAQIVPFAQTSLWTSTEAMEAAPGDYEVSLEFETASGQTSAVQRRAIEVPSFGGDRLQLSDVLLAYDVQEADAPSPGRVFRDGLAAQPAPWGVFGNDEPIFLFFEVYGLELQNGQSDFEVEARLVPKDTSRGLGRVVRRIFGGRDRGVSASTEAQGSSTDEPAQYLILDASSQEPGLYTLTVTVRDRVSGDSADRETDLLLE
ncbi:MAG: tetratricopeptide repeat protein [Bacteroidota bacterium]